MDFNHFWKDLPVLLLYDLDPSWSQQDIQDRLASIHLLANSLADVGHLVQKVCIQSVELEPPLEGFKPDEYLIFNWCEELPGIPHSESQVAQSLERLGFTFTGAGSQTLSLYQANPL